MKKQIELLERFLGKADIFSSSQEAVFFCTNKECPSLLKHKKKLSVSLETGKHHCWVCGKAGRSLRLLLKPFCSEEEIKNAHKLFKNEEQKQQFDFIPSLPEGFIALSGLNNSASEPFFNYLRKRNVSDEQILQFKLGITFDDENFKRRIIFPSFDSSGFLNFVIGRALDNVPKKYHNSDVPKGWKNHVILNELNIDFDRPLVIVEGFFDLFSAGSNATFLAGNDLSMNSRLFYKIVEHKTTVYLALDSDAQKNQLNIAKKLYRYGIEDIYFVDLSPYKDPGSMSVDQFRERLAKSKRFTEIDPLLLRIKELC